MNTVAVAGASFRVADAAWSNPLDATFAAKPPGKRWNPPGQPCLYLCADRATARSNVERLYSGLPYGPEDLDPATAPVLLEVSLPAGWAADAFTDPGLEALGLPATYPVDAAGHVVPHRVCQPLGQAAFDDGLDGVDARSAAPGGGRELAWFPLGRDPVIEGRQQFEEWY